MKRQEVKQFVAVVTNVESRIVEIRRQSVLLDADVADLYGVETRRINEAVRNNPDKFPSDYMFALTKDEAEDLRSKISTTNLSSKSRVLPKAFTEKGLYMLATVLKSRKATSTTFAIIQSIPSPKAEPFKVWMAKVAAERIDKTNVFNKAWSGMSAGEHKRFKGLKCDIISETVVSETAVAERSV